MRPLRKWLAKGKENKMAAITNAEYVKHPESWWIGKKLRALRDLQTGMAIAPKGSILTVTRKFSGFTGVADPCPCCKMQFRFSKFHPSSFELVEE